MEVCGGQPRAPRPDASPHPRRGRRRGRILFVLSRGRRRSQVLGRRVLTKNGNVPNTRVRARWSVFPGRARRTGVLDDPRGPRREAREIYARSDTDDRGGHRGEPPRCLPAHRQTHLDAPRAGGTGEDVGGLPMDYRKFSSASRHSPCYVPRGSPSDLRAAPAPGEAPNRPLCCSLLRSGRRSFASRRRSIWRRRGGGRRESRATKI